MTSFLLEFEAVQSFDIIELIAEEDSFDFSKANTDEWTIERSTVSSILRLKDFQGKKTTSTSNCAGSNCAGSNCAGSNCRFRLQIHDIKNPTKPVINPIFTLKTYRLSPLTPRIQSRSGSAESGSGSSGSGSSGSGSSGSGSGLGSDIVVTGLRSKFSSGTQNSIWGGMESLTVSVKPHTHSFFLNQIEPDLTITIQLSHETSSTSILAIVPPENYRIGKIYTNQTLLKEYSPQVFGVATGYSIPKDISSITFQIEITNPSAEDYPKTLTKTWLFLHGLMNSNGGDPITKIEGLSFHELGYLSHRDIINSLKEAGVTTSGSLAAEFLQVATKRSVGVIGSQKVLWIMIITLYNTYVDARDGCKVVIQFPRGSGWTSPQNCAPEAQSQPSQGLPAGRSDQCVGSDNGIEVYNSQQRLVHSGKSFDVQFYLNHPRDEAISSSWIVSVYGVNDNAGRAGSGSGDSSSSSSSASSLRAFSDSQRPPQLETLKTQIVYTSFPDSIQPIVFTIFPSDGMPPITSEVSVSIEIERPYTFTTPEDAIHITTNEGRSLPSIIPTFGDDVTYKPDGHIAQIQGGRPRTSGVPLQFTLPLEIPKNAPETPPQISLILRNDEIGVPIGANYEIQGRSPQTVIQDFKLSVNKEFKIGSKESFMQVRSHWVDVPALADSSSLQVAIACPCEFDTSRIAKVFGAKVKDEEIKIKANGPSFVVTFPLKKSEKKTNMHVTLRIPVTVTKALAEGKYGRAVAEMTLSTGSTKFTAAGAIRELTEAVGDLDSHATHLIPTVSTILILFILFH